MTPAGRRSAIPDNVIDQMIKWRAEGATLASIAQRLNDSEIPTPGGGQGWYPQSVRQALISAEKRRPRPQGSPGDQTVIVKIKDVDDTVFGNLVHAIWFAVATAKPDGDFDVQVAQGDPAVLNTAWRSVPEWT